MIARHWQTIRYLRPAQLAARVKLRASARMRRLMPALTAAAYERRAASPSLRLRQDAIGAGPAARVRALRGAVEAAAADPASGSFTFLDTPATLGWPPDWTAAGQSQLWRYHLHYFDMLAHLAADEGRAVIANWIDANPIHGAGATRDAWHPYVASLRLANWLVFLAGGGGVPPAIGRAAAAHALFIERNLETDVGGNHLLKNLKAMVFAGCAFEGTPGESWRRRFAAEFASELERQLLADGGHYERSPMYHCQVLGDAIETAIVLDGSDDPSRARLDAAIARMDGFLATVTHPDGDIALFNDSAFGMAPAPRLLHEAAAARGARTRGPEPIPRVAAAASGYVTLPADNPARFLIADAGKVCPDDLPAHAHADLLSFELSLGGTRLIVDSGVGEYAAGEWRDYYRSTRAHNTVSVDGAEQSDCYGSFRVGRRAAPIGIVIDESGSPSSIEAAHDGFARLAGGVMHRRRWSWNGESWLIEDTLTGGGDHAWASFCHFHPAAQITMTDASHARIERGSARLEVRWHGFASVRVVQGERAPLQGWYAERFGAPVPAPVLVLEGRGPLPARFGYALVPR